MTTLALAFLARGVAQIRAFGRYLVNVLAGIRDGHEIARRYEVLSHLSDQALARRGLTREDVPHAAVTGKAR